MFIPSLLTLVFTFLTVAPVFAGGTSSNGGGGVLGDQRSPLSSLSRRLQTPGVKKALSDYLENAFEEYPDLKFVECGQDRLRIPQMPESFNPGAMGKLRFQLAMNVKKQPVVVTTELLCKKRILLEAYSTFAVALHRAKDDPVIHQLVNESYRLGGAVEIVFVPFGRKISAKGGRIYEYTWFDSKTDRIFYSSPPLSLVPQIEFRRRQNQMIRHELAHVLMRRALGERYPQARYWHDARVNSQPTKTFDFSWLNARTSEPAAYIEGLANALELDDFYQEHPHVLPLESVNRLSFNSTINNYCYGFSKHLMVAPNGGTPLSRLDNEIVTSTVISNLFKTQEGGPDFLPGKPSAGAALSLVDSSDEKIQRKAISAIANHAPGNLMEFARAFDRVTGEDGGWRWYREFFHTDYRTGKSIDSELIVAHDLSETGSESEKFCLRDPKAHEKFYSPWAEARQKLKVDALYRDYARAIAPERLLSAANAKADELASLLKTLKLEFGDDFGLARKVQATAVKKVVGCEGAQTMESISNNGRLRREFSDRAKKGLFSSVSEGAFTEYLIAGCANDSEPLRALFDNAQKTLGELQKLALRITPNAEPDEHSRALQDFQRLEGEFETFESKIRQFKSLTKILEEWSK